MADAKPPKASTAPDPKAAPPAPAPRPREIKDAGQRIVFAALEFDSHVVAKMLVESMELPPLPGAKAPTAKDKDAELKRVLALLEVEDGGGATVWVRVGKPVEGSPTKADAVQAAVDTPIGRKAPGRFRAPSMTHWRGEQRRRPPTAVPLDEEVVD